jgi:hypothetical protein
MTANPKKLRHSEIAGFGPRNAQLGRLCASASVREWFRDSLRVIRMHDVANSIFLNEVHHATVRFQHAPYFVHPRYVLQRVIAEPRDASCVAPIVPFGGGPVKALGNREVFGEPPQLFYQRITIMLRRSFGIA